MRIDRLELRNFKKFSAFDLELHPQFTLLIGDNGAGKTSVLDALAVALGVWLVEPPDSTLINTRAGIHASEIRLEGSHHGDRELFSEAPGGVSIRAFGQIEDRDKLAWEYRIEKGKRRGTNPGAADALAVVKAAYEHHDGGEGGTADHRLLRRGPCMAAPSRATQTAQRSKRSRSTMGRVLRVPE